MYQFETAKTVLNSEVKKFGKRRVRAMLQHQGYSRDDVFRLVPADKREKRR